MRYAAPSILVALLLAAAALRAGEPEPREPVNAETAAMLREFRGWDFATFRKKLPSLGASGGFFPKIITDDIAAGFVVGMCRRYPDRIAELVPPKVKLQERFRLRHYASLCLGGGARAAALLRAVPQKDADLVQVLDAIDAGNPPLKPLLDFDPWNSQERQVLMGALLVHSDPGCALRLLTCLAVTPEQLAKQEDGDRRLAVREEVIRLLAGFAVIDDEIYRCFRDVRLLAATAMRADLDWILAQGAAARAPATAEKSGNR